MEIIYGQNPPNHKAIAKRFNIKGRNNIVYTYGDKLYVPGGDGIAIDPHLMKHEETHVKQQAEIGVEAWWDKYLTDDNFRFIQELEAYRNQYRSMNVLPLNQRLAYLDHIATDLSGPMYGDMLSKDEAIQVITNGIILKHVDTKKRKRDTVRKLKKRSRQNRKKGRK